MSNVISLQGGTQIYIVLDKLSENVKIGGYRGLQSCAKMIIKTVSDGMLQSAKTGKKYSSMRLRSSSAGEYPANQTGRLRRGLGYQMQGQTRVYVGNRVHYSRYVANGTRNMSARRFIKEAMRDNLNKIYETIDKNVTREVSK